MKNLHCLLNMVIIVLLPVFSLNYAQNFSYGSNVDKIFNESCFGDWFFQNKLTIIYIEQNQEPNNNIVSYLSLLSHWGQNKLLVKKFSIHNFDNSFTQLSKRQVFSLASILIKYPSGYFLIFDENKIVRYSGGPLSHLQLTQILKNYLDDFGIINKHRLQRLHLLSKNFPENHLFNKLKTHSNNLFLFIGTNCEACNIEIINSILMKTSQISDLKVYLIVPNSTYINSYINISNDIYWVKEKKDYDIFLLNDIWVATLEYDKGLSIFCTQYDIYSKLYKYLDDQL